MSRIWNKTVLATGVSVLLSAPFSLCLADSLIDYNQNTLEELAAVKKSNAYVDAYTIDDSELAQKQVLEMTPHGLTNCRIISINWEHFNSDSPSHYLRLPGFGNPDVITRFVTELSGRISKSNWTGLVLGENGGRASFYFGTHGNQFGGYVSFFDRPSWTIAARRDHLLLCEEDVANNRCVTIEVPKPDR